LFVEDFNYGPGNPRMSNRVADHPATGPTYSASNWMYCEHQLGGVLGNTDAALLANIVVTKSVGLLQYRVFMENSRVHVYRLILIILPDLIAGW
jgi:hypothetical protein